MAGHRAPVVAFAYIALGVPAVVLWWNLALHLRRSASAHPQLPLGSSPATAVVEGPSFASLAEEDVAAA